MICQAPVLNFTASVFLTCSCGWLMVDNVFGYYCDNPWCQNKTRLFEVTVAVTETNVKGVAA